MLSETDIIVLNFTRLNEYALKLLENKRFCEFFLQNTTSVSDKKKKEEKKRNEDKNNPR